VLPGFRDKRLTEALGHKVQHLIDCRASGETLPTDTSRWIETLPSQTTKVLARWGLLQGHTLAASKALTEHLADWKASMLARALTEKHLGMMYRDALRIFTVCKVKFLSDIRLDKVQSAVAAEKDAGLSLQTCNHLIKAVKAFTHWVCRDGRIQTDPLAYLTKYNVALDRRHDRRALSPVEAQAIIQAAETGPTILGMDGHSRAVLYRTVYGTGFRAN
jgi:site-specific recombinase XerD